MTNTAKTKRNPTVADVCSAMETLAPTSLAQAWDNVGLLAGDPAAAVRRVLLCIDLTPAVLEEATGAKTDLAISYHPPLFRPVTSIRADSDSPVSVLFRCIERRIAVYSPHTALDAAGGGTNDVLAGHCGIKDTEPIEYARPTGPRRFKLVVFAPADEVERVADAMFQAGAGRIGDYTRCSFRTVGQGTFYGGAGTRPAVGTSGRLERVDETRLETIVDAERLSDVIGAMVLAHSYEEPAYDVYPLTPNPAPGIGRIGTLPQPTTVGNLAQTLKNAVGAPAVQIVGPPDATVRRAVVAVGAAGDLPFRIPLSADDVIVTGEIRHHDALRIERVGCGAIALGHWESERPVLAPLGRRLSGALFGVDVRVSEADRGPLRPA